MKSILLLILGLVFCGISLKAQPANDFCQNATNIGTLVANSQRCTAGTNVAANPEFPYPFQNICTSGGATPTAADDVWYTFTMPAGSNELRVTLTGTLPGYSIAFYNGACGSLNGLGCATAGAGGINNVLIQPLAAGQTYYIQVSGNSAGAQGTFNLCLTARDNPNLCVVQSSITATPQPVNGSYYPGQVITFCYTVSDYNQLGANWFHGVQIILGAGWQAGSLAPVSPAASCDATGNWAFYNSVTSSNTGLTVGPGFFYDRFPLDGNPGNNFGDNCSSNNWVFCFSATVPNINCSSANPDLSVSVRPFADGQTGSWSDNTCNVTPTFVFNAILQCCQQPLITVFDETCPNACDGIAIAEGQGGTAPYTYAWASGSTTDSASALCGGSVNVTVTDDVGCQAITTVIINSGGNLNINTSGADETCIGAADGKAWVVNASPSLTYTWNTVPPQNGDTAFALTAGTYQVIGTGTAGCADTATVAIGSGSNFTVGLAKNDISCNGVVDGKAWVVSGNANFTYNWNTVPPQIGDTVFGLAAGVYELIATGPAGCADTATITIIEPTILTATATADTTNCGGSATGNTYSVGAGGTIGSGYAYSWNSVPVQNTATATNLAPGTYTVIVTDANGCTATADATVVSTPSFTTSTGFTDATCFGTDDGKAWAVPSGGQPPFTTVWSTVPPQNTDTAFNLAPGLYDVTITDANNCSDQFTFIISEPNQITSTPSITDVSCNGLSDGEITLSTNGGVGPYSYLWSDNSNNATASTLIAGTYSVDITDSNGCAINVGNLIVNEPATLTLVASPDSVPCYGGFNGSIALAVNGGTPTYSYLWSNNRVNQNLTFITAGSYSVTVTDRNGCIDSTSATVEQPDSFAITVASTNVTCFGSDDGSIDVTVSGATPPYQYQWSANTNNFTGSSLTGLDGATYQVTVTDGNNCTTSRSIRINEPTRFRTLLSQSIDSTSCDGIILEGSITNNTNGGTQPFSYNWSSGDTTRDITSDLVFGTYTVTSTDGNGCTDTATITLNPKELLTVTLLTDSSGCYGDSSGTAEVLIAGGRKPYTIIWADLDSSNTKYVRNLGPGNYDVMVVDAKGCDTSMNFTITEQPAMGITVPDTISQTFGLDTSFTGTINGVRPFDVSSIFWSPSEWFSCDDCIDPTVTAIRQRAYIVELNVNGCLYYDTLQLMINYGPDPYYIPNAFSPNGDGVNDYFQIFGIGIKEAKFTIYNRWGGQVFTGEGINATWDGTYNGKQAEVGTYVYNVHLIYLDQRTERITGSLILLR